MTLGYRLVELNAKTGAEIPSFGEHRVVDLKGGAVTGFDLLPFLSDQTNIFRATCFGEQVSPTSRWSFTSSALPHAIR